MIELRLLPPGLTELGFTGFDLMPSRDQIRAVAQDVVPALRALRAHAQRPQPRRWPDGASDPPRGQTIATAGHSGLGGNLVNKVNLIYVTAASAADIPAVQSEISQLLPRDTVTTPSSLAGQVTGSLSDATKLTDDLGTWVSVLALIAAFAVASLLTTAAVARRAAEFGTLKALGWHTRWIVAQVLGESLAVGIAGAVAGVVLGFTGAAILGEVAPKLSATDSSAIGSMQQAIPHDSNGSTVDPVVWRAVSVALSPSITVGLIVLAVILAVAGGLLADVFGVWRIARLRPADALTRVA